MASYGQPDTKNIRLKLKISYGGAVQPLEPPCFIPYSHKDYCILGRSRYRPGASGSRGFLEAVVKVRDVRPSGYASADGQRERAGAEEGDRGHIHR